MKLIIFLICLICLYEICFAGPRVTIATKDDTNTLNITEKGEAVVVESRYTIKPSTATIKYFTTSTTYTSPYPISGFSIVCFGDGATLTSNVGDINNIPFIDGFGVSTELDQPKSDANFIFTLQPNTTVYLTTR